jgi:hypothetical protein
MKYIFGFILGLCISQTYAYTNFSRVRCETLHGEGYVMVYLNDQTYKIDVVCK